MDFNVTLEERSKALKFCRDHLDGIWKEVTLAGLTICKLCGGMSNLLYYCALLDTIKTYHDEPRQVLLRLYGPSHGDTDLQLEIFKQLATENLGPKLLSTFDKGRLEEYLPSSPLSWTEMTNDQVSAVVARKIAAIHKLKVKSLNKNSNWLLDRYNEYNQFLIETKRNLPQFSLDTLESTKEIAYELIDIDFEQEIDYLAEIFDNLKAPLVFSHNDLHQNNILLLHKLDKGHNFDDRIVLIDFEYCSYNYRTFDAANHLSEWCFDYNGVEYPYFSASAELFPSEEKQRQFLSHYIDVIISDMNDVDGESNALTSNDGTTNSKSDKIDILLNEMQPFLMASNLLWALWAIKSAFTSKIKFGYWEMAKWKWDIYLLCKKRFKMRSPVTHGCERDFKVQSPRM